uniref:Uncharacterized protein n=1 Tax=Arundo donax TaxID=35708 RepID=A0A0A9D4W2_ARUDO
MLEQENRSTSKDLTLICVCGLQQCKYYRLPYLSIHEVI